MKEMSNSVEPRGMRLVPALVRHRGAPKQECQGPAPLAPGQGAVRPWTRSRHGS